jgi:hypothetical protein
LVLAFPKNPITNVERNARGRETKSHQRKIYGKAVGTKKFGSALPSDKNLAPTQFYRTIVVMSKVSQTENVFKEERKELCVVCM